MTSFQFCIICIIALIYIIVYYYQKQKVIRFENFIKNSDSYFRTIDQILNNAYNTVYKEQVVAFSAEGLRPDSKTYETIQRNFIKLVLMLMGERVEKELVLFFGDAQTLIQYINTFFQSQLDNDEILEYVKNKGPEEEGND